MERQPSVGGFGRPERTAPRPHRRENERWPVRAAILWSSLAALTAWLAVACVARSL